MHYWYLLSVWLHILAAMVWIGSMAFLGLVVVPILRRPELVSVRTVVLFQSGLRFRRIGWAVLGILIVTGIVNVAMRGYGWKDVLQTGFWTGGWGGVLGLKLALVLVLMGVSAAHDFYIGPRAALMMQESPEARDVHAIRRVASLMGRLMLLLSLVIVALAVMLVRGW